MPQTWNNLGNVLKLKASAPRRSNASHAAVKLMPGSAEMWNNLGNTRDADINRSPARPCATLIRIWFPRIESLAGVAIRRAAITPARDSNARKPDSGLICTARSRRGDRFFQPPGFAQRVAQVVPHFRRARHQLNRDAVTFNRLIAQTLDLQDIGKVVPGLRHRLERDRLPIRGNRLVDLLFLGQRHADVVPRLGVFGIQPDGFAECTDSLRRLARGKKQIAELVVHLGNTGLNAKKLPARFDGGFGLAAVFQGVDQVPIISRPPLG